MTDTAIFQRPDWSDPTQYEHLAKIAPGWELAWEFLRRNPDYQADWAKYLEEHTAWEQMHLCEEYTGLGLPPKRFFAWCDHFKSKWQLETPTSPADDFYLPDDIANGLGLSPLRISVPFVIEEFDNIDEYQRVNTHIDLLGAKVLIPVNLELRMETIMEKVKAIVEGLREQGIRNGTVTPITDRIQASRLYVEQLRALDAEAAGLTPAKFSMGLLGNIENGDGQRNKTARARLASAKVTMEKGYRLFISA